MQKLDNTKNTIRKGRNKLVRTVKHAVITCRAITYDLKGKSPNPFRIFHVNPHSIKYFQTGDPTRSIYTYSGRGAFNKYTPKVLSGDWDLEVTPVEETLVYRGLHQRFVKGEPWDNNVLHPKNWCDTHPNIGYRYRNCSESDFNRITQSIEILYSKMAEEGYLSQMSNGGLFWEELTVNIGRDGTLIRNSSGQHRLIIAKLLNVPLISVRVLVVHSEWNGNFNGEKGQ